MEPTRMHIKKELKLYGLLMAFILIAEYLALAVLNPAPFVQLIFQIVVAVIFMTATLRTGYRIWTLVNYGVLPENKDEQRIRINGNGAVEE